MLRSARQMRKFRISATDGEIGGVHDFYFDDESWIVRYLVVDTGHWLPGRKVLLPPSVAYAGRGEAAEQDLLPVRLTREQIKEAPARDTERPVSRQFQVELHAYYGWPAYWGTGGMAPAAPYPFAPLVAEADAPAEPGGDQPAGDPNLRSARDVTGYQIEANDGGIGHVEDFLLDDDSWEVRYLVIDTRNWLPGRKVLVRPQWVERIDWAASKAYIDLTRGQIEQSPEYDPASELSREYERNLHNHYRRPIYWS